MKASLGRIRVVSLCLVVSLACLSFFFIGSKILNNRRKNQEPPSVLSSTSFVDDFDRDNIFSGGKWVLAWPDKMNQANFLTKTKTDITGVTSPSGGKMLEISTTGPELQSIWNKYEGSNLLTNAVVKISVYDYGDNRSAGTLISVSNSFFGQTPANPKARYLILGIDFDKSNYTYRVNEKIYDSGIKRTAGWHVWEFRLDSCGRAYGVIDGRPFSEYLKNVEDFTNIATISLGRNKVSGKSYYDHLEVNDFVIPDPGLTFQQYFNWWSDKVYDKFKNLKNPDGTTADLQALIKEILNTNKQGLARTLSDQMMMHTYYYYTRCEPQKLSNCDPNDLVKAKTIARGLINSYGTWGKKWLSIIPMNQMVFNLLYGWKDFDINLKKDFQRILANQADFYTKMGEDIIFNPNGKNTTYTDEENWAKRGIGYFSCDPAKGRTYCDDISQRIINGKTYEEDSVGFPAEYKDLKNRASHYVKTNRYIRSWNNGIDYNYGIYVDFENLGILTTDIGTSEHLYDTRAEETGAMAMFLASASNFYPTHPNAAKWEAIGRFYAFHTVSKGESLANFPGGRELCEKIKTLLKRQGDPCSLASRTVSDDFALGNHGIFPNTHYAGAPIWELQSGQFAYLIAGKPIPKEFFHNIENDIESGIWSRNITGCGCTSQSCFAINEKSGCSWQKGWADYHFLMHSVYLGFWSELSDNPVTKQRAGNLLKDWFKTYYYNFNDLTVSKLGGINELEPLINDPIYWQKDLEIHVQAAAKYYVFSRLKNPAFKSVYFPANPSLNSSPSPTPTASKTFPNTDLNKDGVIDVIDYGLWVNAR